MSIPYQKTKHFVFHAFFFYDTSTKNDAFIVDGFQNWKYVSCDKKSTFAVHETSHSSFHNAAVVKWSNLMDPSRHIDKRMNSQSLKQVLENRLQLKTSIVPTKRLAKQTCAFRGHDESVSSLNCENFIELIKLLATMNEEINKVVLENALKNA